MDKSYGDSRSATLYVLHGETFLMWDGKFSNGVQAANAKLHYADGEWGFFATTATGKGKDRRVEWEGGKMEDPFKPLEIARGNPGSTKMLMDEQGNGFIIAEGETLTITKLDHSGQLLWEHSAPFGINYNGNPSWEPEGIILRFPTFRILNGRLAIFFTVSKGSLDKLLAGEGAKGDLNTSTSLPTLAIWDEGKRSVLPLLANYNLKDASSTIHHSVLGPKGVLLDTSRQKRPSTTLVPIIWE